MVFCFHECIAARQGLLSSRDFVFFGLARFMDDIRAFALHRNLGGAAAESLIKKKLSEIYPPHYVLKLDAVNPCIGVDLMVSGKRFSWKPHVKSDLGASIYGLRGHVPFQWYNSFQAPHMSLASLSSGLSRCFRLSSSIGAFASALSVLFHVLVFQAHFPREVVVSNFSAFVKKKFLSDERRVVWDLFNACQEGRCLFSDFDFRRSCLESTLTFEL